MKKISTAIMMTMLCLLSPSSGSEYSKSKTAEAINFLMKTDQFVGTHECYSGIGVLSYEACAFKIVSEHPSATKIFHRVYKEADIPGKIYALIGLYYDDQAFFQSELTRLLDNSGKTVLPPEGNTVAEILISKSPKSVRLSKAFPTIDEWLDAQKWSSRSFYVDVYGGSYSELFFNADVSATQDFRLELSRRKKRDL